MANKIELKTVLGGVEDLLLDASSPSTVTQTRSGVATTIHKINLNTIPAVGKYGEAGYKSLATYLTEIQDLGDDIFVTTNNGGIGLVVGNGGLTWDGGTPASNKISLAQKLSNGKYRWIGQGTIGSDNWVFRGRVSGQNAVNASDYVTKSQMDTATQQSDWNQSNTSSPAFIKNKPTIPSATPDATHSTAGKVKTGVKADLDAGTDAEYRAWSAKDLKDFSQANAGGSSALAVYQGGYSTPTRKTFPMPYTQSGYDSTGNRDINGNTCHYFTWFLAESSDYRFTKYNDSNAHENIQMKIYKNGSLVHDTGRFGNGDPFEMTAVAGDFIGVCGVQTSSGNNSNRDSYVQVEKL